MYKKKVNVRFQNGRDAGNLKFYSGMFRTYYNTFLGYWKKSIENEREFNYKDILKNTDRRMSELHTEQNFPKIDSVIKRNCQLALRDVVIHYHASKISGRPKFPTTLKKKEKEIPVSSETYVKSGKKIIVDGMGVLLLDSEIPEDIDKLHLEHIMIQKKGKKPKGYFQLTY